MPVLVSSDRTAVLNAVFALITPMTFSTPINGQSAWVKTGQRLIMWGSVPPDQQPAAFLITHREEDEYRALGLVRRRLYLQCWCYARTDDPTVVGQTYLDTMMKAFEAAFVPDSVSENLLTLGGLVYWCRIEGRVFKDPGDIDSQALLIVPIVVEMP